MPPTCNAAADLSDSAVRQRLTDLVEVERSRFGVPGLALLIVKGDDVFCEGFGTADGTRPVTAQTTFPIGSATKTFTAALVLQLAQERLLELDAPLRTDMPELRLQDRFATELLSATDCLSHRSGLPRHDLLWYAGEGAISRDELIAALAHLPPSAPFRQGFQYNNLLYIALGHLAGRLLGGSFEDALRARLLAPLGIDGDISLSVDDLFPAQGSVAVGHVVDEHASGPMQVPYARLDLACPAGGINTSAQALEPWVRALLGQSTLLPETLLEQMRTAVIATPRASVDARPRGYGLGLMGHDYRGMRILHHNGNVDGFSAQVLTVPDEGMGIVILTNLGGTAICDSLPLGILDVMCGRAAEDHGGPAHMRMREFQRASAGPRLRAQETLKPVRPTCDYGGTYHHPGYGDLTISDDLRLAYRNGPVSQLEHRHLEVYEARVESAGVEHWMPVQFTHGLSGDVDSIRCLFEPAVPPITFQKTG
jgi:CubicO group peptidase (beta-lactamase class C family)